MSFESAVNYRLNKYPALKRVIKRIYQGIMYTISPKIKSEGEIVRISPNDGYEYFFGYYDKSPWDITNRYMLCLRAKDTWTDPSPKEKADIIIIDTALSETDPNRIKKTAETSSWNVQQGCMAQWLGTDFSSKIIYNDCRNGKYISVILELSTKKERIINAPVYTVSQDGKTALTLDFSRLYNLRPGYGYYNVPEKTKGIGLPDSTAIWKIDLENGNIESILRYGDFAEFQPREEMKNPDAIHKVNHLMLSPNGKRFMVLYRWFNGSRKYTRLITCDIDGKGMYLLSDDDMVSHCYWKDDENIIAFENKKGFGQGYYLMRDKTQEYIRLWPHITNDGHPSYSPDGKLLVTDSYPNRARISNIKVMNSHENITIARVFSPFKYDNDTRCDLHPRWSRDGQQICFDSVFEGNRGLYTVSVRDIKFAYDDLLGTKYNNSIGKKIKIVFMLTSCKRRGPVQQTLNIIKNLDQNVFEPVLLTLYEEEKESRLADYLPYLKAHIFVKTGKKNIISGKTANVVKVLEELKPDIIHTVGVFPDYLVSRLKGKYRQFSTLHNYVYEDYTANFGKIKGLFLAKLQLYTIKHADKAVTCSKSLSEMYETKLSLHYDYIQNGVDIGKYTKADMTAKKHIREELKLPKDAFILVYTGQLIERKNVSFLLQAFTEEFKNGSEYLLILGDGAEYENLSLQYGNFSNVDFRGKVSNVDQYLKSCDVYVSCSKSEGLPLAVLEAMATGLPFVLSDIPQHVEIHSENPKMGLIYKAGDIEDLKKQLRAIRNNDVKEAGNIAYKVAHDVFDAVKMSQKYQEEYKKLGKKQNF